MNECGCGRSGEVRKKDCVWSALGGSDCGDGWSDDVKKDEVMKNENENECDGGEKNDSERKNECEKKDEVKKIWKNHYDAFFLQVQALSLVFSLTAWYNYHCHYCHFHFHS